MALSVLLLGATGFLGGTVLTDLERDNYTITCVVRPEREACLSGRKTKVVVVSTETSYINTSPEVSMNIESQLACCTEFQSISVDNVKNSFAD